MQVWLNGQMVAPEDAMVPIDDHGLVVGDGAFETLKTSNGLAFAVSRHLRRLERSLSALDIDMPDPTMLRRAIAETVEAAGHEEGRIRLTVTAGPGSLGSGKPAGRVPSVVVAVTELHAESDAYAITVPWTRNERGATAGLKTTSYAENVRALRAAHLVGASEAIFANTTGELCEGTGTNVFVVIDGECLTPPLASGCLAGVTRELLIEASGSITEQPLPLEVLETADEIFLTSTTRDVQGLERIDDRKLAVGPVTERLASLFAEILGTPDP